MDSKNPKVDRRQVVKTVLVGGALATLILPTKWTKPIVNSIIVPAHAQASAPATTTTTSTSTPPP